jgi:hypothetical protein
MVLHVCTICIPCVRPSADAHICVHSHHLTPLHFEAHVRPAHHLHICTQMSSLLDRVSNAVEVHALPPIVGWEDAPEVGLADALAGLGLQNAHLFIPTALDTAEDFIA